MFILSIIAFQLCNCPVANALLYEADGRFWQKAYTRA